MFSTPLIFSYVMPDQSIPQSRIKFFYVPGDCYSPFCSSSTKWSLSFGLNVLKPICIYALYRMFHTSRPFTSPLFHQPNIPWWAQHILRLPLYSVLLTSFSLLPVSTKLSPKLHSTLNIAVCRMNSKYGQLVPIGCVVISHMLQQKMAH